MRGRIVLFGAILCAGLAQADVAQAQFSPRGILGAATAPLREMLGRFGHFPRVHRRGASEEPRPATAQEPQLGMVGPLAWPTAYADMLGYALWPDDYGGEFRAHGFDVIADSVTGRFGRPPARSSDAAGPATNGAAAADAGGPSGLCNDGVQAQDDWPSARIEQTVQLTDPQRDALKKLQAAFDDSVKAVRAGCRDTTSLPPSGRLNVLVQRLWAVRDAGTSIRAPLKAFYDSLTDAQKAGFQIKQPPQAAQQTANNPGGAMGRQVQACAGRITGDADHMIQQIEQTIRPGKEQAAGLQALHKTSSTMAQLLAASCVQPIPADPLARLDAADNQLTTMNYAATAMQIALDGFYAQLDTNRKARFDSLGR
jgi:hypothetical protein